MKPGTIIKIKGKLATVVYHNLDGYGIIWDAHEIDPNNLQEPEAMLREPYPGAQYACIAEKYTIVKPGKGE